MMWEETVATNGEYDYDITLPTSYEGWIANGSDTAATPPPSSAAATPPSPAVSGLSPVRSLVGLCAIKLASLVALEAEDAGVQATNTRVHAREYTHALAHAQCAHNHPREYPRACRAQVNTHARRHAQKGAIDLLAHVPDAVASDIIEMILAGGSATIRAIEPLLRSGFQRLALASVPMIRPLSNLSTTLPVLVTTRCDPNPDPDPDPDPSSNPILHSTLYTLPLTITLTVIHTTREAHTQLLPSTHTQLPKIDRARPQ